ncbi:DNA polymerase III subunit alpha [Lysinibacillus sp. UGB7]|uniref:DNA polymerase III subunit alpha n=1 Tax=Lysinibacillus sp. UGB7 TaxID=3411039 RepID=UPI003B772840
MCNNENHLLLVEGIGKTAVNTNLLVRKADEQLNIYDLNGKKVADVSLEGNPVLSCFGDNQPFLPAVIVRHVGKKTEVNVLNWGKNRLIPIADLTHLEKGSFVTLKKTEDGQSLDIFYTKINAERLGIDYDGMFIKRIPIGRWAHAFARRGELKGYIHSHTEEGITIIQITHWADLHRHSGFSMLDGATHLKDMIAHTEFGGAVTDHGNMFGAVSYYQAMKLANKLPILGFEAYCETMDGKKDGNHLWLVAKNDVGIKNLMKLTSLGFENIYRKPHISYDMLEKYGEGIISSTSCLGSEVSKLLLKRDYAKAKQVIQTQQSFFGEGDFYVEIQRHGIADEEIVTPQLMKLARELSLPLMATTDSHYTDAEDAFAHEVLLCIGTKKTLDDESRLKFEGSGYHLHTIEEVEEKFADIPEALDGTLEILEKCADAKLGLGIKHMPRFPIDPLFKDAYSQLEHWVKKGYAERFKDTPFHDDVIYRERLEFEMSVIKKMNYADYFLIVGDTMKYAHDNDIWTGPGRGSGAGSLVLYTLKVTNICPIPYDLLFERFLNPERVSDPDVDLDFDDSRRHEMFEYVKRKYGERKVSRIITFQTLGAKTSTRDVARVLDVSLTLADKMAKLIPNQPKMTLKKAYEESADFKALIDSDDTAKRIFDIAKKIEGLPRNPSVHACGVVIAEDEVSNIVPETIVEDKKTKQKMRVTQFQMADVEAMGMLKMDFLGLRTISVNRTALDVINRTRNTQGLEPLVYEEIPINDVRVYEEISKGQTYGIFQLESAGMREFMKDLFADVKSNTNNTEEFGNLLFERLVAGVSLYRPGPIDHIPEYLSNMRDEEKIVYDHEKLVNILKTTYGVITYQEQTMLIVRELAGFTKGEADEVRKAFAKKLADKIEPLRLKFLKGCKEQNIDERVAQSVWNKMKSFAEYAFNKSHAAAYSTITAKSAYLSTYYPVEFMTAILNSYLNKPDKIKIFLNNARKLGMEIVPPDVNISEGEFTAKDGRIVFGLQGLKGLGKSGLLVAQEAQSNRGEFKSLQDVFERMASNSKFDKTMFEILVHSGALDSFGYSRKSLISAQEDILKFVDSVKDDTKKSNADQMSLLDFSDEFELEGLQRVLKIQNLPEIDKRILLELENEYVGFYLTGHPLDEFDEHLKRQQVYEMGDILIDTSDEEVIEDATEGASTDHEIDNPYLGTKVKFAGVVKGVRPITTRKGESMVAFEVEDRTSNVNAILFPKMYSKFNGYVREGAIVVVAGTLDHNDFGYQLIIDSISDIEEIAIFETPKAIKIFTNDPKLARFSYDYAAQHPGHTEMYVCFQEKWYRSPVNVMLDTETYTRLSEQFGDNMELVYEFKKGHNRQPA